MKAFSSEPNGKCYPENADIGLSKIL